MASTEIPLFLLSTVLFPGGRLALKVFERRYLDMVSACLKHERPFGVCLIRSGREVGAAAEPWPVGTLAHVVDWHMPATGILHVTTRGGRRFRIVHDRVQRDQLRIATIELLPEPAPAPVGPGERHLVALLERLLAHSDVEPDAGAAHWQDATWVSARLAERLPLAPAEKQRLLELADGGSRLARIAELLRGGALGNA